MRAASTRRILLVGAVAVAAALLLPATARLAANRYHDDTLWANALGSLGGTQKPGDFGYVFLPAGDAVLDGRSPYMDPDEFEGPPQAPYAYPPVLALLVSPLTILPEDASNTFVPGIVFTLLLMLATVGALLVLEVRDWRCYPVALLYPVTLEAFEYGAIGPVLLLLIAVLWRFRDRVLVAGSATAGAVVLKLFLWPLLFWLVLTRRVTTAVLAAGAGAALALGSWAAIAFRGIDDYPRLLRKLVDVEAENSYSAFAILRTIGIPELPSQLIVLAAGIALLAAAWRVAHAVESSRLEQDRRSLTLVLAAALLLTPILWLHYLVLLVVPIALARPRLSALWFAPLALSLFEWLDWYRGWPSGEWDALLSVLALLVLVFAASLRRGGEVAREGVTVGAR